MGLGAQGRAEDHFKNQQGPHFTTGSLALATPLLILAFLSGDSSKYIGCSLGDHVGFDGVPGSYQVCSRLNKTYWEDHKIVQTAGSGCGDLPDTFERVQKWCWLPLQY